jgi:DNA-binding SARP family transcriptional activator
MEESSGAVPTVRLRVVSGFQLSVDDQVVRVPIHVERVLAYLAIHDRDQPRHRVASHLWMDLPDVRAAANLRTALWRGRAALGGLIVCTRGRLSLDPLCDVDVRRLDGLARRLLHLEAEVSESDVDLSLMTGDLLPDWDDEWLDTERERIHQLRVHALEAWCGRLLAAGRFAEALDVGLLALAVEPLRETAQRLVIQIHLAEGNVAEACRRFQRFSAQLWDEMGLVPSRELRDLVGTSAVGGRHIRAPRRSGPRRRQVIRSGSSPRSST